MATYQDLYDEFGMDSLVKSQEFIDASKNLRRKVSETKRRREHLRRATTTNVRRNKTRKKRRTPGRSQNPASDG
ncbi:hypothetical protein LCGC14_2486440, partial [marine sediment metagenome]